MLRWGHARLAVGGLLDPDSHERTDATTVIETADLTTHGGIVGMTGSGKTGMGIVLVEECLAAGIPALVIDPKGDLTNLCLTFLALAPADFAAGQDTLWRDGLAEWGLDSEQLTALRAAVEFEVYTPGSAAGRDLDLASLVVQVQQPPMRKLGVFELDQFSLSSPPRTARRSLSA